MTYVLTFTNDTDSYSQNLQLEGIREALLNDCEIHKIDEEISFEKIDNAVEEIDDKDTLAIFLDKCLMYYNAFIYTEDGEDYVDNFLKYILIICS